MPIMKESQPNNPTTARNNDAPKLNKQRRGTGANPDVQTAIAELIQKGFTSAPEIRRRLVDDQGFDEGDTPTANTIRDLAKEMIARAESAEWTLADAELSDIPLVLPVWTYARSEGLRLSAKEAKWVVRIRTAASDLPLDDVLGLAGVRVNWPDSANWIEALIGFAPWRNEEHAEKYFAAVNAGRISTTRAAAKLAVRAFLQDDGGYVQDAKSCPESVAYFENLAKQPRPVITVKGGEISFTYETRKERKKESEDDG